MKGFAGTTYDEVPYMAASFANTHPEVLAVTALMRGLDPPPLAGARVLELGCARGANLVPMAWSMPGAEFVGVDLSRKQIEEAQALAAATGTSNVTFHAMDLRDLDESFGEFDYIVGARPLLLGPARRPGGRSSRSARSASPPTASSTSATTPSRAGTSA